MTSIKMRSPNKVQSRYWRLKHQHRGLGGWGHKPTYKRRAGGLDEERRGDISALKLHLEEDMPGSAADFDVTNRELGEVTLNLLFNNWFETHVVYQEGFTST